MIRDLLETATSRRSRCRPVDPQDYITSDVRRVGLSDFVREAIAEKLEREPAQRPSAYDLGKDLFGKYGSGRDDLSTDCS
jgi:hypothetical protein